MAYEEKMKCQNFPSSSGTDFGASVMMCLFSVVCGRCMHPQVEPVCVCMCVCVWDVRKGPSSSWHLVGTQNRLVFVPFSNKMVHKSHTSLLPRLMQIPRWEKAAQSFPAGGPFPGFSPALGHLRQIWLKVSVWPKEHRGGAPTPGWAGSVENALPLPQKQRTRWREILLSLQCHQCFLFFCHLLCTPGKRETERQGTGGEARSPSGSCCSKPRKAHKYLRLSRKKFPPRGPNLESHSHPRELFLQESPASDVLQSGGEWEPAEQRPEAEVDADLAEGPPLWTPALPPSEVTVTDITANSITVTFREAQAAEGFFRDRSGKF
ncbi:hypothetical protein MC885_015518 [Smutsia gigantea]|nr:hypothetical protein MC885_015518 [Smutsia gigantea]